MAARPEDNSLGKSSSVLFKPGHFRSGSARESRCLLIRCLPENDRDSAQTGTSENVPYRSTTFRPSFRAGLIADDRASLAGMKWSLSRRLSWRRRASCNTVLRIACNEVEADNIAQTVNAS